MKRPLKIQKLWKLVITCEYVASMGATTLEFFVCDLGENIGSEVRCCETLATAAAFRTQESAAEVKELFREPAAKWFKHHGADGSGQAPTWATVLANMQKSVVSTDVLQVQADMVDSMQGRSQPCS